MARLTREAWRKLQDRMTARLKSQMLEPPELMKGDKVVFSYTLEVHNLDATNKTAIFEDEKGGRTTYEIE